MMYLTIVVKIIVGMLGVLFFLRISGKTQMAQLTPLDSVNAFVLGALVGGVIYSPDVSAWELVFFFGSLDFFQYEHQIFAPFQDIAPDYQGRYCNDCP